jgi:hypothetical protein
MCRDSRRVYARVLAQCPQITQQWYRRTATRLADAEEHASQGLADTTGWVLIPAGALRCAAGVAGCRLAGDVPPAGLAAAGVRPDMAVIQMQAGRPW